MSHRSKPREKDLRELLPNDVINEFLNDENVELLETLVLLQPNKRHIFVTKKRFTFKYLRRLPGGDMLFSIKYDDSLFKNREEQQRFVIEQLAIVIELIREKIQLVLN